MHPAAHATIMLISITVHTPYKPVECSGDGRGVVASVLRAHPWDIMWPNICTFFQLWHPASVVSNNYTVMTS